MLFLMSASINC